MKRQPNNRSSIYQGSDGRWHGRVSVGLKDDGKPDRRHVMAWSKTVVAQRVRELEKARDRGELRRADDRWKVGAWLDHWLENIARPFVKQSTYEGYRAAVRVHLIPGIGNHWLESLRPEHLERLYVSMLSLRTRRGTLMSPGRVAQVHRTVRASLNVAKSRGYITRNPAELAKTPTVDEFEVEPFTIAEIRLLFAAASSQRNSARWVVALALGLRQGEALGLQWPDVDWSVGRLQIRRSRTRPRYEHGCGATPCGRKYAGHCPQRRDVRPPADTTKTRAGRRTVPLPDSILDLLREHQAAQATERQAAAQLWADEGWVFATETGEAINPRTDWDSWKRLLQDAGVRDGRLHDARHTAATVLLLLGVHERTIMSMLGWSTTTMVSRYAHVIAPIQSDVARRLDGLLWPN